ncbi:MAG TPA: PAN domain-containing protein [Blastocatellia bacterium]|nr:PAN domain-containing protein [Blastocatellia bacterium]
MKRTICLLTPVLILAFVLLLPPVARLQSLGAAEANTALQGYYQRPSVGQCQADCANNANCKGFTWIQAGTYNANDAAMCYLLSAVTGKTSARTLLGSERNDRGQSGWDLPRLLQRPQHSV